MARPLTRLQAQLVASVLREALGEVESIIDAQTYDERAALTTDEADVPDGHAYTVKITEAQFRAIGKALSAADAAARDNTREAA